MNAGYFIEQDLMYQTDAYSATVQPSDEKSTLQKEVEDNEDIDCLMKTLLKQAILTCLKMAVGDCAKHECHGCKMTTQVRNTTISVYGLLQENGLKIMDVMIQP